MADDAAPVEAPKKSKTPIIVALALVIEAVAIIGVMMFVGKPSDVQATDVELGPDAELEKIAEVQVVDAKLPNNKLGVTYLYDTQIFVQVKRKHEGDVAAELEQFQNEITAEIVAIWRAAEPRHFQEPRLETLSRKIEALMNDRFGVDADDAPIIQKCVIIMQTGFRVDS